MNKRNVATALWFLAGWSGAGLAVGLMGLPSILAPLAGVMIGGLAWWDPAGLLWPRTRSDRRRVVPVNEFAADLDRKGAETSAPGRGTTRSS